MDKEWSAKNQEIQTLLGKEATYKAAINRLIAFRKEMLERVGQIVTGYPPEAFYQMPFAGADGYHSKTLAYSIWHIFRIEDIVAHEMIAGDRQVFFAGGFDASIHAPIITTGNELSGEAIAAFSRELNIPALYRYARETAAATDRILQNLSYADLKRKFGEDMAAKLRDTKCVSDDEAANWLIAYWCGKDVRGLIKMPFSRHWIMHIEAMRRIKNRLCQKARKGIDPMKRDSIS